MTYVVHNTQQPHPETRIPSLPQEVDLDELRLILLPPGRCDFQVEFEHHTFDVNLGHNTHEIAVCSDKRQVQKIEAETFAFFLAGTSLQLRVDNPLPGCLLEVRDDTMRRWMEKDNIVASQEAFDTKYRSDRVAADLGRAGIRHLMRATHSTTPAAMRE
ncbi:hypothetical protein [Nereida sp. MMG025]|uniref:hypothetical protein n=1 Tax=Nereida sp. MMG025 TaxID=2909981 RepID=UPI001F165CEA|nr:hypothetical protein [Nereida sp. MMG025]MCF6446036.1 hypothetical protein [Nereida sp. MMG025]